MADNRPRRTGGPPGRLRVLLDGADARGPGGRQAGDYSAVLDAVFQSAPDFIMLLDRSGRIQFINRPPPHLRREQVIGSSWLSQGEPPLHHMRRRVFEEVLATREVRSFESVTPGPGGASITYWSRLAPVVADGVVTGAVVLARDVTERRQAEAALQESQERLRLLHELGDLMAVTDDPAAAMPAALRLLGGHLRASRAVFAEIDADGAGLAVRYEYTDGCPSLLGRHDLRSSGARLFAGLVESRPLVLRDADSELPPADAASLRAFGVRAVVGCVLAGGGSARSLVAVHQTAPRDWTAAEIALVEDLARRIGASYEQRSAESKLRQNEALLRIAGRAARLGGWSVTLPERRVVWSDEVCAIHDIPPGTTPSIEEFIAFYAPEYRTMVAAEVGACLRDGAPFDFEAEIVTATSRRVWVRAIGHAERATNGAVALVQGALQDVTERRRLEEQFFQAQKMEAVGQLAGGIAHDFNNLLTAVVGFGELALSALGQDAAARRDVEEIIRAGHSGAALTHQLLAFSRRQLLDPQILDLNAVVTGMRAMLERLIGEDVDLRIERSPGQARVNADRGQMEQVILNLAINARDAMPTGGTLTIDVSSVCFDHSDARGQDVPAPGRYVRLVLSDTGTGMDEATCSRVFEPFFTTKPRGKGTGLGLATVYGIVKQSGGSIAVASRPGAGTTFTVHLPQTEDRDVPGDTEAAASPLLSGSETVLIVEDQPGVRGLIRATLLRNGYRVLEAGRGDEAIEVLRAADGPVHLLLTDVVLPGMSGRQVADALRRECPDLRVIYMSGYTDDAIVRHGVLKRGLAFLPKPFTATALLQKVRETLSAPAEEASAGDA